jgi:hypothetical protein
LGIDGVIKELHLDCVKDQGYEPMYFMKMMFEGYSRCLYVYTGVESEDAYFEKSKSFAESLNLRHECRDCDLKVLKKALAEAKDLAWRAKSLFSQDNPI